MEIAIRVVVVFFVALVVAGSIIYFAEDVFSRAKDLDVADDDEKVDQILRVESLQQRQFTGLLQECATRADGIESEDCFAITSASPISVTIPSNVSGVAIHDNFTGPSTSMFIRYDLGTNQIVVE